MTWSVNGYCAQEIVGFGASGEVWRGVSERSGDSVALKRLRVGSAQEDRQRLRREAALLGALAHPHLLRLHEVVEQDTEVVLVLDLAEGGSLGGLLGRRGQLLAGEVVTALAPVADALAMAHAHGVVHGDVSPGNILLTADGRPLLADLGTARLVGEDGGVHSTPGFTDPALGRGAAPTAASDVYALAAVAVQALTGALPDDDVRPALDSAAVPAALRDVLLRCLEPQQEQRPGAGAVGRTLLAACPPVPLRMAHAGPLIGAAALTHVVAGAGRAVAAPGPGRRVPGRLGQVRRRMAVRLRSRRQLDPGGRHRSASPGGRRRPPRIAARVVVAVVVVAVAALVGVVWGTIVVPEQPSAMPVGSSVPSSAVHRPIAWSTVLDGLDTTRAAAFAAADAADLRRVYVAGSQALVRDEASLRTLTAAHVHATGVRHQVLAVQVVRSSGSAAVLHVADQMSAYAVLDPAGRVVQRTAPRGRRSMTVSLVRTVGGWRIADLSAPT